MIKQELGIFDFLNFLLVGGTALICFLSIFNMGAPFKFPNELWTSIPLILLSYWLGHVISELGRHLERKFYGEKQTFVKVFEKHSVRKTLIDANDDDLTDTSVLDRFYDVNFYKLESEGKLGKVNILLAQYAFFRSVCALLIVFLLLLSLWCIYHSFSSTSTFNLDLELIATFCIPFLMLYLSISLMRKRRRMAMSMVYFLIAANQ